MIVLSLEDTQPLRSAWYFLKRLIHSGSDDKPGIEDDLEETHMTGPTPDPTPTSNRTP